MINFHYLARYLRIFSEYGKTDTDEDKEKDVIFDSFVFKMEGITYSLTTALIISRLWIL